ARAESRMPLQTALTHPLHEGLLREKLCAFGETEFSLRKLTLDLEGALALPPSELKRLRRAITEGLMSIRPPQPLRQVSTGHAPEAVVAPVASGGSSGPPKLIPLLRTLEQVDVALELGFDEVQLDFMELVGLGIAVERVRAKEARVI